MCRVLRREFWPLQFLSGCVSRWFQKPLKVEHVWNVKVLLEDLERFERFLHLDIVLDSDSCTAVSISVPGLRVACPHLFGRARMKVYRIRTRRMSVVFPLNSHFQNLRISTMRTLELPAQHHVLSAPRAQYLAVGDCNLLTPGGGPRTTGIPQVPELTIGKHLSWYSFKES